MRIWPARVLVAVATLLPAVLVGAIAGYEHWTFAWLAVWAALSVARATGRHRIVPLREHLISDGRSAAVMCGLISLAAVFGLMPLDAARSSLAVVLVAAGSMFVVHWAQPHELKARRTVLVGSQRDIELYVREGLGDGIIAGCHVLLPETTCPAPPALLAPTLSNLETLSELVSAVEADAVLVLPGVNVTPEVVRELTWMFEDTPVSVCVVCPISSVSAHRLRTSVSPSGTVLELGVPRATTAARFAKGLVDLIGAAVLLAVFGGLLAVLWLAVRVDSKGPGFFVQTRVGKDGRPFRMVKLRTMRRDAESLLDSLAAENESDGVLFKIKRDPRITRMGYWLRRSSLDELPQLFNVLRGDMSLVGPRPALPEEVAEYDMVARRRLVVKPGITGLWQVSGRSDLLWDESLRLDLYYADNWRLLDDLSIAARTVTAVAFGRGAY